MRDLISINIKCGLFKAIKEGKLILNKFENEMLTINAYYKIIFPFLLTNPR